MNNKRIEKLIPKAIAYINTHYKEFKHEKKDGIDKAYSGYLSSFGPTIITAGINKTVAFYQADTKKSKITNMLFALLKENKIIDTDKKNLLDFISKDENYKSIAYKNKILDATIACKLAIRTFDLKE